MLEVWRGWRGRFEWREAGDTFGVQQSLVGSRDVRLIASMYNLNHELKYHKMLPFLMR